MKLNKVRLYNAILATKGKVFTVGFTKKNGQFRVMNARLGVKKGVKGTGHPNGIATSCIKVYDMQKRGFRQINLNTVKYLKASKVKYEII